MVHETLQMTTIVHLSEQSVKLIGVHGQCAGTAQGPSARACLWLAQCGA